MIRQVSVSGYFDSNCFFFIDEKTSHGFLIDPGAEGERLVQMIRENGWTIEKILLTHGHIDHIAAVDEIRAAFPVPVMAYETADTFLLDPEMNLSAPYGPALTVENVEYFRDGDVIRLEADPDFALRVIYTPGHTDESVILYAEKEKAAFVGDTIYKGSMGDYEYPGGNEETLRRTILERVLTLPEDTALYNGHTDPTTVGEEKGLYTV